MGRRPTKEEIQASYGKQVPDILEPGLEVLFCGINPSLYSAAVGHHFARPGNRFWKTLAAAGFTGRVLKPEEDRRLLDYGFGLTNIVERATARADELSKDELSGGVRRLEDKVRRFQPNCLAVLGISAYRTGFGAPKAALGLQEERLAGVSVWVLPNPSGLNAHYQVPELAALYQEMRLALRDSKPGL